MLIVFYLKKKSEDEKIYIIMFTQQKTKKCNDTKFIPLVIHMPKFPEFAFEQ